jgi:hypothetical protein
MSALTTLAAVKAYLGITTNGQDTLIPQLIARESALVEQWTGRQFPSVTRTDKRLNGNGGRCLTLPDEPIISVSALTIDGRVIPAAANSQDSGYLFNETTLFLTDDFFTRGNQNVVCSWVAGYQAQETAFVPTGNTITPTTGGTAVTVVAVTNVTTSSPMTQVGSSPASGEFSFSAGVFTFNAAQFNNSIEIDYYYIPAGVEQAVIEMVGLDLQQRNNLGLNSKTLATETVTYEKKGIADSAKELLQPYKRMGAY